MKISVLKSQRSSCHVIDQYSLRTGFGQTLNLFFITDESVGVDGAQQPVAELDGSLQRKDYFGDGDAVCMVVLLLPSADIDECADGFVECDSKSTCVNLPGWYHCECRDGYHDNGLFSTNGESCVGEWPTFALYGTRNMVGKFRITTWILNAPEQTQYLAFT